VSFFNSVVFTISQRQCLKVVLLLNFEELKALAPHGKVKLTIEYDGANFHGWQRQGQGMSSIQQTIEDAIEKLFKKKLHLIAAGRTDAGVHAENQIAHFIAPRDVKGFNFVHLFQAFCPPEITIKKAEWVPPHFHAQRSAISKTYIYRVWNNPEPSALRAKRSLWIRKPLDVARLNEACKYLLGTHDFSCFRSEGSRVNSTVRTLTAAKVEKRGDYIEFEFSGTGFLKQMVRNMVGTLLQIELNDRDPLSLPGLIASKDRTQAGPTVQPQGLYLARVFYPPELDNLSQPL
jgi:tRNA pseudouridine38-40 synthase